MLVNSTTGRGEQTAVRHRRRQQPRRHREPQLRPPPDHRRRRRQHRRDRVSEHVNAAAGGGVPASTSTASAVNAARTDSARPANRRNHPRTVAAGRPTNAAIRRCPTPAAFATRPAPITSRHRHAASNAITGSSTWVRPQPVHAARRGRTRTSPSTPRSTRGRAKPQPSQNTSTERANQPTRPQSFARR